jgi:DNA invertase Pin-like site-specific DNA recombinase
MNQFAAIYLRVSKADKKGQVSESIENQRALLERFCKQDKELCRYETRLFVDDGYSGLEENRPALQELLRLVRQGKVFAVLVKDFSRLSRNHLYLAMLREQLFPSCGTILLSAGDGYDSRQAESNVMVMRFKGLFYEYYSKDISRKVKTALAAKKEKGEYAVAKAPFGYRREGACWRVEKEEAALVYRMYVLASQGKSCAQIAELLHKDSGAVLYPVKVWRILRNPVYCGKHVWHKYENQLGGKKRSLCLPAEQWKLGEGSHKAIVSQELFRSVQAKKL